MGRTSPLLSPAGSCDDQHATHEIPNSQTREIQASHSSTSDASSQLIHSRDQTIEGAREFPVLGNLSVIRRMESEIEWLYERNAELQEENETLREELNLKEREHRQWRKKLQNQLDTAQATLHYVEMQNRSSDAATKLLNQKSTVAGEGAQRRVPEAVRYLQQPTAAVLRRMPKMPASSSVTDSMGTSVSTESIWNHLASTPPAMGEKRTQPAHRRCSSSIIARPSQPIKHLRKKVSWQDECGPQAELCRTYPAASVSCRSSPENTTIVRAGSTSSDKQTSPKSPISPSHLTPAPPSFQQWLGSQHSREFKRLERRRVSETPPPASTPSLYEELGLSLLRPSPDTMSTAMSDASDSRQVSVTGMQRVGSVVGSEQPFGVEGVPIVQPDQEGGTDPLGKADNSDHQDASYLERCKALFEDRSGEFWMQMQFWCVVGIFIAGVLSKGKEGVVDLARRR